jgi:hypothetical protein
MTAIQTDELRALLARGSLREADPSLGIGRELSFIEGPARTIVVHFGSEDSEQYRRDVTDRILALEDSWLLVPRHAAVGSLGILAGDTDAAAIRFDGDERASLSNYLCTRAVDIAAVSADLYAVSASGSVLLTWDHHTAEEGLDLQFRRVPDAGRVLGALNDLGAELELFYVDDGA